jgi:hypothetical protein
MDKGKLRAQKRKRGKEGHLSLLSLFLFLRHLRL